jgi:hypothetical protein
MARTVISLNDTKIRGLKPMDTAYTISDGNGLQLNIKANGTKLWEFRYISPGNQKRRKTSFGKYPTVSLFNAREKRSEYQELISNSIDPIDHFRDIKKKQKENE